MMLQVIAVLLLLTVLDYLRKFRRHRILCSSNIRGPKIPLPIIGDIWEVLGINRTTVFEHMRFLWQKYGITFRIWFFHHILVISVEPQLMEAVLSSQKVIKKSIVYDMLRGWLGDGLLVSSGQKWRNRRKILTPSYHFGILEQFVEVFDQQSRILVQRLKPKADGRTALDIFPIVCLNALDIIAETVMESTLYFRFMQFILNFGCSASDIIGNRMVKPHQYIDIGFLLSALPSYLKLRKCIKTMHAFTDKVISDRINILNKTTKDSNTLSQEANDVGQKKRLAFLDVLLNATIDGQPLTRRDIREEVDTFMFEGHDTTTSAISHCLYELARHPVAQQKVLEEALEIFGNDTEQPVTMKQLHELNYLEKCLKESLRLHPSVPVISRYTEEDLHYGDNKCIPAHTMLVFPLILATRNADIYPRPNDFVPERFLDATSTRDQLFTYVPFSAGPRNCIGQNFAMLEMKSVISMILRHYELLPLGKDLMPTMHVILRSETGVNLGLRPRKLN